MQKLIDCFTNEVNSNLYNITFSLIENNDTDDESIELVCNDSFNIVSLSSSSISIRITRTASFIPERIFNLSVEFEIIRYLNEEYVGNFNWDDFDIEKEIKEDFDFIACDTLAKMSLLISQITNTSNLPLIITPPIGMLIDEKSV